MNRRNGGKQTSLLPGAEDQVKDRFWRTPPEKWLELEREFEFDFDAAPFPRPHGWDALSAADWPGSRIWVNPPFEHGVGAIPWVRKCIEENGKGKLVVLILSVNRLADAVDPLLAAGAEARVLPSMRWLNSKGEATPRARHPCVLFILRPKVSDSDSVGNGEP